jgi:hypothetical protein
MQQRSEGVEPGAVRGRALTSLLRALIATTPAEGKLELLSHADLLKTTLPSLKVLGRGAGGSLSLHSRRPKPPPPSPA